MYSSRKVLRITSTFTAEKLGEQYGTGMFYLMLVVGVLILFSTQLGIFEALVRNFTDAAHATSPRLRRLLEDDPRKFYYPYMLLVLVVIAGAIHLTTPVRLVQISADLSNVGAVMFPVLLMFLDAELPGPARPRWGQYVFVVLRFLFLGGWFVYFVYEVVGGGAWV